MQKSTLSALLFTACLLCCSWSVRAQQISAVHQQLQQQSALTRHSLELDVYLPFNYDAKRSEPYPLLYTTAGDSRFAMLQAQLDWLSHTGFSPLPQMVIVRVPRLSYTEADALSEEAYQVLLAKVLQQEVHPWLRKTFNLAPYTLIEGYSSRANLALALLQQTNEMFDAAVILAPALELQSSAERRTLQQRLTSQSLTKYLYLSLGNFSANRPHFDRLRAATADITPAITKYLFDDLSTEHYHSSAIIGLERGLRQLFADRNVTDFSPFISSGNTGLKAHHQQLSLKYGYEIDITDNLLGLGQYYFAQQMPLQGQQTFNALIESAPDKLIFQLRYAQALLAAGLTAQAQTQLRHTIQRAKAASDTELQHYAENLLAQTELN